MEPLERLKKFQDENFDLIIVAIRAGRIKCGKYAQKIKVEETKIEKELFTK